VEDGDLHVGDVVTAAVAEEVRRATMRNHTAAHLLQAALREVLGDHVHQAGQLVTPQSCRFDFSHFSAMTKEEIQKVEQLVNEKILAAIPVVTESLPIAEARKRGAMALFGEKYGDVVRVVSVSDFSVEFCGGTHVDNTAKLGLFRIVSENSVASGVRRIEAVTGTGVLRLLDAAQLEMQQAAQALKLGNVSELAERCTSVMAELKEKDRALESLNQKISDAQIEAAFNNVNEVKGVKVISAMLNGVNPQMLRKMGDRIKAMDEPYIAVLAGVQDGKGSLLCACSKAAIAHGAHAGQIVQRVAAYTGGKGGGKAEQAMAGVGQTYMIDEALMAAENIIRNLISEG
jgi:alanyl-tRNA synthetase